SSRHVRRARGDSRRITSPVAAFATIPYSRLICGDGTGRQPAPAVRGRRHPIWGKLAPVSSMDDVISTLGLSVLVVDDCADAANTLARLVRLWGHRAEVALDGEAALRLAAACHPDVVFLDIAMPRLTGWE